MGKKNIDYEVIAREQHEAIAEYAPEWSDLYDVTQANR